MKKTYQAPAVEFRRCTMAIVCTKSGMGMCKNTFVEK